MNRLPVQSKERLGPLAATIMLLLSACVPEGQEPTIEEFQEIADSIQVNRERATTLSVLLPEMNPLIDCEGRQLEPGNAELIACLDTHPSQLEAMLAAGDIQVITREQLRSESHPQTDVLLGRMLWNGVMQLVRDEGIVDDQDRTVLHTHPEHIEHEISHNGKECKHSDEVLALVAEANSNGLTAARGIAILEQSIEDGDPAYTNQILGRMLTEIHPEQISYQKLISMYLLRNEGASLEEAIIFTYSYLKEKSEKTFRQVLASGRRYYDHLGLSVNEVIELLGGEEGIAGEAYNDAIAYYNAQIDGIYDEYSDLLDLHTVQVSSTESSNLFDSQL